MWTLFFISLLPLILYVIVDFYADLKWGVIIAIGTSLLMTGVYWALFGELDFEVVGIVVVLTLTGLISLRKNDPIFIKFQPVITNIVLILILSWFQWFDQPLFLKYLPKMKTLLEPKQLELLSSPEALELLARMSGYSIFWIVVHTVLVGFAALKLDNRYWLLAKASGVPVVVAGSLLTELFVQYIGL
jgi:intracellular septation protein A